MIAIDMIGTPALLITCNDLSDFRFTAANNSFYTQFGLSKDQVVGRAVQDVLPASEAEYAHQQIAACWASGHGADFDLSFERAGLSCTFRITLVSLVDHGRIKALIWIISDITDQHRAERDLRNSYLHMARGLATVNGVSWRYDTVRRTFDGSPELALLLGESHSRPVSFDEWIALVHPDDQASYRRSFDTLIQGQVHVQAIEFRALLGSGVRWLRCHRVMVPALASEPASIRGVAIDATDDIVKREHLAAIASRDGLTGLLNRSAFFDRLQAMLDDCTNDRHEVTAFMLDLDDFKPTNDTHGHLAGDAVLQAVGERLRVETRDADLCGRLGGDEFAVAVRGLSASLSKIMADVFRSRIGRPVSYEGKQIPVGLSIGLARCTRGTQAEDLMAWADQALYADKRGKRYALALSVREGVTRPCSHCQGGT